LRPKRKVKQRVTSDELRAKLGDMKHCILRFVNPYYAVRFDPGQRHQTFKLAGAKSDCLNKQVTSRAECVMSIQPQAEQIIKKSDGIFKNLLEGLILVN
jgi:hypothetical protein